MTSLDRTALFPSLLLGLALSATSALAEDAVAITELNVRSGPGSSFAVIDVLQQNERVTMSECQTSGWCYVTHDGPDGWVSAAYLAPVPGSVDSGGPDCNVVIEIGPEGPRFRLECGGSAPVLDPALAPAPALDPDPETTWAPASGAAPIIPAPPSAAVPAP